ncbi:GNAT family N-acetyltransferase [Peribacillus sp. SCS-155]
MAESNNIVLLFIYLLPAFQGKGLGTELLRAGIQYIENIREI